MTPPVTDHFNGKTFFNPGRRADAGLLDVLRWQFNRQRTPWPRWVEISPSPLPATPQDGGVAATWVNHSTFLLQTSQGSLLTDPVFSDRVGPVSWAGPRRVHAPGVAFGALPRIDVVLLSHDHYDHCDLPSLHRLAREHQPLFIAPLGHRALLAGAGATRIIELDWWQTHQPWAGFTVTLTPTQHWSRRTPFDTNASLWGGYMVERAADTAAAWRYFFPGDTGYSNDFKEIRHRLGAVDFLALPIGAYLPRDFMKSMHVNPADAVQLMLDLQARQAFGVHWGTFKLTQESFDQPPIDLALALKNHGLDADRVWLLRHGETRAIAV